VSQAPLLVRYTDTELTEWVGPDTFRHAMALVSELEDVTWGEAAREGDMIATGRVAGKRPAEVTLMRMRGAFSSTCDCAIRRNCRHAAALAVAVRNRVLQAATVVTADALAATPWQERLAGWTAPAPTPTAAPEDRATYVYRLRWPLGPSGEPELQVQVSLASSTGFQALAWHLYRVGAADAEADQLVEPVLRRIRAKAPQFRDGASRTDASWLVVPDWAISALLPRLGLHPRLEDERRRPLAIHATFSLRAGLAYRDEADGPRLQPIINGPRGPVAVADAAMFGPPGARWAAWRGEVFRVAPDAEAAWTDTRPIVVPDAERDAFERQWLPALSASGVLVDTRVSPLGEWPQGTPRPQLVIEEEDEILVVRPGFLYDESRVEATGGTPATELAGPAGGPYVRRDGAAESRWLTALAKVLPAYRLRAQAAMAFLDEACPALAEAGWTIVGRERLPSHRLLTGRPVGRMRVESGADWFDLHSEVLIDAQPVTWRALQEALEDGAKYVRLGSGDWARLPSEWLAGQKRLRERLNDPEGTDPLRVPRHQAPQLAEVLESADELDVDAGWTAFRDKLASFGGIEAAPIAPTFTGTLRPYQQQGLNYLSFLRDYGLHGILADDMGLGKTVQAAALLAANHPNAVGPSLIVAPTSVVANWEAELKRFVPTIRVLRLHGPDREAAAIADCDVVITTYATARLDMAIHKRHTYHTVILDEAQAIKNGRSQTARAMRQLQAHHRLCLTGTPIENDVGELWSLFAFLMPSLLGAEADFRTRFAVPVATHAAGAREALRRRVGPFILRRLKSQVATDLPPRTDITLLCDLAPAQRQAYETLLTGARSRIQRSLEVQGLERSRLTILAALLKLREACCHPALLGTPETLHLESGKLEAAMTLIEQVIAGGHRALVFSQFTRMLTILRERLDAAGVAYEYLDGRTRDRQSRVDRFNTGTAPLFLISLKAGGTGLNLTGADYVIHYDPWWNPASEDQATDRAHRIGQTRQVFNYKLVARDTIEEKLIRLQGEKRELVRDLLETDGTGQPLTALDLEALFG
jgi:non-specific serine/threonine protein kinase